MRLAIPQPPLSHTPPRHRESGLQLSVEFVSRKAQFTADCECIPSIQVNVYEILHHYASRLPTLLLLISHPSPYRCRQGLPNWLFEILADMAPTDMLRLQGAAKSSRWVAIHRRLRRSIRALWRYSTLSKVLASLPEIASFI